jgi:hypothetical protein
MRGKQAKILSDDNLDDLMVFTETSRHPLRNKVIVLLAAKAGLRAREIALLTWANYKWLKRVREEEAQASHVPTAFASGELVAAGMGIPINTSRPYPSITPRQALPPKTAPLPRALCQLRHEASRETPKARLRRRLEKIRDAWDDFQANRARDAVYGYLEAVFAIVEHYKVRRRLNRLLRHAFKFANKPRDKNADPFSAVIRCTCDDEIDSKTISKWARALRYVAHCMVPRARLKTFMKEAGGVNACATRYAKLEQGRNRRN